MPKTPAPTDEWIIGDSPDSGRIYIVHMERPRFVMEMVEDCDGSRHLGEIRAIDWVPKEAVDQLMSEAVDVFSRWIHVDISQALGLATC